MAVFDHVAASHILKVRYIGQIREQLNNATILLNKIGKQDQPVSGKNYTVPLHTGRNLSAATGRQEYENIPPADYQKYNSTIVPNAYLYGRIEVTGQAIASTRDNMGAFVDALNAEVEGLTKDFKRGINRQLHGDGTDTLWVQNEAGNTAPIDLSDGLPGNNAFGHATGTMTVDTLATGTYAPRNTGVNVTITRNAAGVYQITAINSGTWAAGSSVGDVLIPPGTRGSQMMGIRGIVSNVDPPLGDLQGLDAATYPDFWQAQVFGNAGTLRAMSFEDIQEVIDAIATLSDSSEDDIDLLLSNYPMRRSYFKLCIAERRHVNTMQLDGGFSALDYNGKPWVVDAQCRRNVLYFLVTSALKIFRSAELDWMDKDGSYLSRVNNKDAYEAILFQYANLAALTRNCHGLYADVIEN